MYTVFLVISQFHKSYRLSSIEVKSIEKKLQYFVNLIASCDIIKNDSDC